jgi:hypothetical protein
VLEEAQQREVVAMAEARVAPLPEEGPIAEKVNQVTRNPRRPYEEQCQLRLQGQTA